MTALQSPSKGWEHVRSTGRWHCHGEDRKFLVIGDDRKMFNPSYWFFVFQAGVEIAHKEGYNSIQEAQLTAEAI